jgi:hypothetical protein
MSNQIKAWAHRGWGDIEMEFDRADDEVSEPAEDDGVAEPSLSSLDKPRGRPAIGATLNSTAPNPALPTLIGRASRNAELAAGTDGGLRRKGGAVMTGNVIKFPARRT